MKLGEVIIRYRERHGLSQREFARKADLSNSLISIIEKGINPQTGKEVSPDLDTYSKIANAMGITMQILFEELGNDATVHLTHLSNYKEDEPEIRIVSGMMEKMTKEQQGQVVNVLRAMFANHPELLK